MTHVPVLPAEVLELLAPRAGEVYVDCTAGLGGHAAAVAPLVGPTGAIILNDVDPANLSRAVQNVQAAAPHTRIETHTGNFADLPRKLSEQAGGGGPRADMVLADLGFASTQVDDPKRGFSFSRDGPLDMRMDPSLPVTAAELVATLPERELAEVLRMYGEERHAGRIARILVREREHSPITTTGRLADVVRSAVPRRSDPSSIDPATRTFQALRIVVNDEIGSLEALLAEVGRGARAAAAGKPTWLNPGARVLVISFHSLEDRPVKQALAELASQGLVELLTDGPLGPTEEEAARNRRSRSSRLRACRIVGVRGQREKSRAGQV
ncbi:MAG: ribosomal RNA small subunit methyltransferase H [Phycisphaerae bacterium]